jgi:hypothetical protein
MVNVGISKLLILVIVLTAGCTQNAITGRYLQEDLQYSDFQILGSSWAFEDNCQYGNQSVAYVQVDCKKEGMECEVYVNDIKSKYGVDGLQPCEYDIAIADVELNEKPDFVSIQNGNKYYYIRRDKNKNIEICCSYPDSNHRLIRNYEVCRTTKLEAQCPYQSNTAPVAKGFWPIRLLPLSLQPDGTLNFRVKNEAGQNAVLNKFYINDEFYTIFTIAVPARNQSQVISLTGMPVGKIGTNYSIKIAVEYYLRSNLNTYYNSTGTLSGTYS